MRLLHFHLVLVLVIVKSAVRKMGSLSVAFIKAAARSKTLKPMAICNAIAHDRPFRLSKHAPTDPDLGHGVCDKFSLLNSEHCHNH